MTTAADHSRALAVLQRGDSVSDRMIDALWNAGLITTKGMAIEFTEKGLRALEERFGERLVRTPAEIALANYRAAADAAWKAYRESIRDDSETSSNLYGLRTAAYEAERNLAELEKTT